ncbi:hypothetical protein ACQKCU_15365 [Heyndrickxia sporothermodurans]
MHDYSITIYPGKLKTRNSFRVANIGELTKNDIDLFLTLMEKYLQNIGIDTKEENLSGILYDGKKE